jgi:hypothetical protein
MMRLACLWFSAALFAGCGGGESGGHTDRRNDFSPATELVAPAPVVVQRVRVSDLPWVKNPALVTGTHKPRPSAAASDEAIFTIEDENGAALTALDLEPIHGKGYPELRVVLRARSAGEASPPQPVRAVCRQASRCEYPLARKYTVSLSDDKQLHLQPRGDAVAVVARVMNVEIPHAVDVSFSVDNRVFSKRRIILLSD